MAKRLRRAGWGRLFQQSLKLMTGPAARAGRASVTRAVQAGARAAAASMKPPPGPGDWLPGVVMGAAGARGYRVYRPPGLGLAAKPGAGWPMVVMLHGCGQDAKTFAVSTRMNRIAAREGFIVLYPEQDRMANLQGCWNWFDTDTGRAYGEADLIMKAIAQVALVHGVDRARVAVVGLSAGASMAALLGTRHAESFRAVVMHSGIPPGSAHSPLSAVGAMHGRRPGKAAASHARQPLSPAATWPPLLVIHGAEDSVVSPRNGQAAALAWAHATGAVAGPARGVQRGQRYPMTVTDFHVGQRLVAQWVGVSHLGHAWSGGAAGQAHSDAKGPDASRLAWAFIKRQWR
jgi:poly(hydroxyalkanoate) depolymerase family esterase